MSEFRLAEAARCLRRGGVVAYPTEGVYGLGCDPLNAAAVTQVLRLKRRPAAKGFVLIAADWGQIEPYLDLPDPGLRDRLQAAWPGPITFVVPVAEWVPVWLRGEQSGLAVRITAHPVAAALCRWFGRPLLSTSANRTGQPPARTALAVRRRFPPGELILVPGRVGGLAGPTPIHDALSGRRLR
ncbi:L-threonylcarbamoyladenylate synthase [Candidatus Methylocalor cossyra]|uniref:L-threonylcarbamoyladenylate synthase n=1 Tax=Candidatus Methylocalor cossyra TaxID=3108543 RepID=UPI0032B3014E